MSDANLTLLVNDHNATGENPYWNPNDNQVYWTDIPAGKLYRYNPATKTRELIYQGVPVGGFTLQADGSLLLFRVNDIAVWREGEEVTTLLPFNDDTATRFNDVQADPEGRVYAGTMGTTKESGGLYRLDLDGTLTKLWAGTGTANGMGFTPNLAQMYWTDTTNKRIYRYTYHRATGELTERHIFYQASPEEGSPDGLTVDTNGDVWSARYRGAAILKHSATDGSVLHKVELPAANITSLTFGGAARDIAYVTSATGGKEDLPADAPDGGLFEITGLNVTGQEEFPSRILL